MMGILFGVFLLIIVIIGWFWIFPMLMESFKTAGLDEESEQNKKSENREVNGDGQNQ